MNQTQEDLINSFTVSYTVKTRAKAILINLERKPRIFMTERNSIQFEYESPSGEYLELEIFEDEILLLYISEDKSEVAEKVNFDEDSVRIAVSKYKGDSL